MTTTTRAPATLLSDPHHDGSDAYVLERPDALGDEAVVRLRVPRACPAERVLVRYVADGEPRTVEAGIDELSPTETWWRASFPLHNPATPYRWLVTDAEGRWSWLNGLGATRPYPADADDFVMTAGGGPAWHLDSVVYEVFPDRFATDGAGGEAPEWAVARAWDDLPTGRGRETPYEWFGGDLRGLERRLDHIVSLGASAVYLTPFFPAGSTHRYDAASFERVDPLLGGDAALVSLSAAAHARGLRLIGDLTLNHCGNRHDWFLAAQADRAAPERPFFICDDGLPAGYEAWFGVRTLPKLDWRSGELRRRMRSVVERWLQPPYSLDGWRIDVANMIGRHGDVDLTAEVAREVRHTLAGIRADAVLVAEHGHDYRADVRGDGWHGVMNYAGFLRPVWTWLRADQPAPEQQRAFWGVPVGVPRVGADEAVATMRAFRAGVPWLATLHSWTLLDSHDTARFRTVAGSRDRQLVGVGLQMTMPGVPMIFAGDELGLEGEWGEDARRPMPWHRPHEWDQGLLAEYRRLIALRRSSPALGRGGLRHVYVDEDVVAYLREADGERLLCLASRADHAPLRVPLSALGCEELEPLVGGDARIADGESVLPADGPAFHVWRLDS